jgi:hypothetical protein
MPVPGDSLLAFRALVPSPFGKIASFSFIGTDQNRCLRSGSLVSVMKRSLNQYRPLALHWYGVETQWKNNATNEKL